MMMTTESQPRGTEQDMQADSGQQNRQMRKPLKRRRGACESCRPKKVRCDGGRPCSACEKSGDECHYVSMVKRWKHVARSLSHSSANSNEEIIIWGSAQPGPPTTPADPATRRGDEPLPTPSASTPLDLAHGDHTQSPGRGSVTPTGPLVSYGAAGYGQQTPLLSPEAMSPDDWAALFSVDTFDMSQFAVRTPVQTTVALDEPCPLMPAADGAAITLASPLPPLPPQLGLDPPPAFAGVSAHGGLLPLDGPVDHPDPPSTEAGHDNPLSVLDFSTHSAFVMDAAGCAVDRRTQSDIANAVKQLAPRPSPYPQPGPLEVGTALPEPAILEECIAACCEEPLGIGNFLSQEYLHGVLQQAQQPRGSDAGEQKAAMYLIMAVLALGVHILSSRGDDASPRHADSRAYFDMALSLRDGLTYVEDSLLKLNALLAMISFSQRMNYQLTAGLVVQATQCAQTLRLASDGAVRARFATPELERRARRAFWYLYAVEKAFCLAQGTFSLIDDDNIQHTLAPAPAAVAGSRGAAGGAGPPGAAVDWLWVLVLYGQAAAAVARELYHARAALASAADWERAAARLRGRLQRWLEALPPAHRRFVASDAREGALAEPAGHVLQLHLLYQYHQALFAIHGPLARLPATASALDPFRPCAYRCEQVCLASARVVLTVGSHLGYAAIMLDRHLLHLPLVAVCTIFRGLLRSPDAERKDLSYLGQACGLMGKLSLELDVPLGQVLELCRLASSLAADRGSKSARLEGNGRMGPNMLS